VAPYEFIANRCAQVRCLYDDTNWFAISLCKYWILYDATKTAISNYNWRWTIRIQIRMVLLACISGRHIMFIYRINYIGHWFSLATYIFNDTGGKLKHFKCIICFIFSQYNCLKVYYDTPYDRHVILEESHDVRYRKRNSKGLEEPPGLGSRILRRLSSKTRDQAFHDRGGVDNKGFQNDVPKSPWRYPFRRTQQMHNHSIGLQRTVSQDSGSSIASAAAVPPTMHKVALSRMLPS